VGAPYHPYVFRDGRFVGEFEEMYAIAERQGFDPWHQDSAGIRHDEIAALRPERVRTLLDLGCGKGTLTARLAAGCERAVGYDVSPTAIRIAQSRYPWIDFRLLDRQLAEELAGQRFDLACALELLSYLPDWPDALGVLAGHADRLLISLYLPDEPAGFVGSFDELRAGVAAVAAVEEELLVEDGSVLILRAESRLASHANAPGFRRTAAPGSKPQAAT
jgi:SAM-dependent methyltransferase